ncbi:MAG: hypothetical protein MJK18_05470, partial [Bdellovibrionales bacterium]|nr:hypothetical protein [Bdellovibrionales bacterium]
KPNISNHKFINIEEKLVDDVEFTFRGKASADVYNSWKLRLNRMKGLKQYLKDPGEFNKCFLDSIKLDKHQSNCKVYFVTATKTQT